MRAELLKEGDKQGSALNPVRKQAIWSSFILSLLKAANKEAIYFSSLLVSVIKGQDPQNCRPLNDKSHHSFSGEN